MANYLYPTNFSNNTGINGVGDFVVYLTGVNPFLPIGFLTIIFLFTFGIGIGVGSKKALLSSSFITFIFSIYFLRMGVINPLISIGLIILTILGALLTKGDKGI